MKRTIEVYGPDPLGSAIAESFDNRVMLELSGAGAPASIRVGINGDPVSTFAGDMGPLQKFPTMAGTAANLRTHQPQALPATSGPPSSSTKSQLLNNTLG